MTFYYDRVCRCPRGVSSSESVGSGIWHVTATPHKILGASIIGAHLIGSDGESQELAVETNGYGYDD
jgi:hypothetical protein